MQKNLPFFAKKATIKQLAEMAERSNAHDSKSCDAGMYPWVQIPLSAPRMGRLMPPFLRGAEKSRSEGLATAFIF